ncbi:MAG: trypsin-like serine protease [Candidatus Buchananbacteria bacterium]|nr:trypsin-like serine protease [Candidatus Buchananbacteria bacterium]
MKVKLFSISWLLIISLFFFNCGTAEDHDDRFKVDLPQPTNGNTGQSNPWELIYQANIKSIPMVVIERCYLVANYCEDYGHGTGFVVADDIVATNLHVAEFYFLTETQTSPGDTIYYQLYAKYPATDSLDENHFLPEDRYITGIHSLTERDIALLQVETSNTQAISLDTNNYTDLQISDSVMIVSYPGFNEFVGSTGGIVQLFQNNGLANWIADNTQLIEYDANTDNGSSGGPVFNLTGQVSGIHFAYIPTTDNPVAISVDYLKEIDFNKLVFETP